MTGEEKTTKKIPNKKITSRMKKIINWEFIQKASDDAESKIKAWKEEILEKNIKEIENHIEAKIENDMVDFENLELSKEIKRKKKNLEKIEKEKNLKNNSENEKKSEEISEKEKQEELRKKLFEEYDIEIIKSDKEEKKTGKIDFKKLFLHIFVLTIILSWVYIVYENKENFINFFTRTWEEKPVIEQEIEKKVDEKVENKMITIEKTDFEIQIVTKEKWKIYKFEWVEYKNFTELKKHLNDLIKQQEKIDSENKVKQRIRAEFFR